MIKKIDHIAVVVRNLEEAIEKYTGLLGLTCSRVEDAPAHGVRIAFLPVGEMEVELMQPLDEDTGIARFLEKRGEGLHHICFQVDDVREELGKLSQKGARLLDREPRPGGKGALVAFLHPEAACGVLVELRQPPEGEATVR